MFKSTHTPQTFPFYLKLCIKYTDVHAVVQKKRKEKPVLFSYTLDLNERRHSPVTSVVN